MSKISIRLTYLSYIDSFRQMMVLYMAWAIMLGGGTGAMVYRCYQVWDNHFIWKEHSMPLSTDPLLIYRVCIIFATVSDCIHETPFNFSSRNSSRVLSSGYFNSSCSLHHLLISRQ